MSGFCSIHPGVRLVGRHDRCPRCDDDRARDDERWTSPERVVEDGACDECGRAIVNATKRFPEPGERWVGVLAEYREIGLCMKCFRPRSELGEVEPWTDAEWVAHLQPRIAGCESVGEAEQLRAEIEAHPSLVPQLEARLEALATATRDAEAAAEQEALERDRRAREAHRERTRRHEEVAAQKREGLRLDLSVAATLWNDGEIAARIKRAESLKDEEPELWRAANRRLRTSRALAVVFGGAALLLAAAVPVVFVKWFFGWSWGTSAIAAVIGVAAFLFFN